MRGHKPSEKFESSQEKFGSWLSVGALGALVVCSMVSFVAMYSSVRGAVISGRELSSVAMHQGDLVTVLKVTLSTVQMNDIVSRMVEPGVVFAVSDGKSGQKVGIEVSAKSISNMQDFKAFRHGIDGVLLSMPGWQWDAVKLCAGPACDKGSVAYALLTAVKAEPIVTRSNALGAEEGGQRPATERHTDR